MTACCDTDVTVFGHTQPDCPDTQLPPWQADAYTERIRLLDELAWCGSERSQAEVAEAFLAARPEVAEPGFRLAGIQVVEVPTLPVDVAAIVSVSVDSALTSQLRNIRHRLSQLTRSQP